MHLRGNSVSARHITGNAGDVYLHAEEGGRGADLLVLLHGLGTSGAVWVPLLETLGSRWRGRWFAPDLPGHGRSPRGLRHSVEDAALAVGDALMDRAVAGGRIVVLGHEFGAAVALALSSGRFGIQPSAVYGVGIARQADALGRYINVSGKPAFGALMAGARCPVHFLASAEALWSDMSPTRVMSI